MAGFVPAAGLLQPALAAQVRVGAASDPEQAHSEDHPVIDAPQHILNVCYTSGIDDEINGPAIQRGTLVEKPARSAGAASEGFQGSHEYTQFRWLGLRFRSPD